MAKGDTRARALDALTGTVQFACFAVYSNPSDYRGKFVVRRWKVYEHDGLVPDLAPWAVVDTLEAARASIPPGHYCSPRLDGDDPVLVETWV